ncbi:MAG TPA: cobyrinate a,c-diamide synthase [Terriglobia bacterium]|nr:cobyrinate a,c-diamide synthase [Terriglobia bacterium]
MAKMIQGFVVAGPASGVGKTTVTLALMAAFRKREMQVQPFKCGPDFIDAGHHTRACGRASRNLDGWMLSSDKNRDIFFRSAVGADVCIVEGVMGLFDGASGKSDVGSTAEMVKLLGLPVVLVVDASSVARSVAALVHGFETFDPEVKLLGVIFNKVAGPTHYALLRDAVESACGAAPLGYLPRDQRIQIPERYLGLFTAGEDLLPDSNWSLLAGIAEEHINLEKLLGSAASFDAQTPAGESALTRARVRVGVARDRAFCFYYEDNLDALRAAGAEIVEFSPMKDVALPVNLDALYFGGGYPELYAELLSANESMIVSLRRFADEGGAIYAECGGLMYLADKIVTRDGKAFPMAGILPLSVQMTERLVNFGYAEVCLTADCIWGVAGSRARGHSFHCSTIADPGPMDQTYRVSYTLAQREESEGFHIKNVLASYIHLHFLSCRGLAATFVANVQRAKQNKFSRMAD